MAKRDICENKEGPDGGSDSSFSSIILRLLVAMLYCCVVSTGCSTPPWEPKPPGYYPNLYNSQDDSLQSRLEQVVSKLDIQETVDEGRVSIGLVDITDILHPEAAWINPDEMMYAASLPKIVILYGLIKQVESGVITLDEELDQLASNMIRYSSNAAASELFHFVGPNYLASLMHSSPHHLYDIEHGGGLWIGKGYEKGFAWCREPLERLSHAASARAVARFYYLLETDQLFSPEYTALMKHYLSEPGINHKFVRGLARVSPDAEMFRKSGSWWVYHSDSAIVESKGRRYIAVALFQDEKGTQLLEELIIEFENIIQGTNLLLASDALNAQRILAAVRR